MIDTNHWNFFPSVMANMLNLVHSSIMCRTALSFQNKMSTWSTSLNFSLILVLAIGLLPGWAQFLQILHVLQMSFHNSNAGPLIPACFSRCCIFVVEACHHLTCNLLRIALLISGVPFLTEVMALPISKVDHEGASSIPLD